MPCSAGSMPCIAAKAPSGRFPPGRPVHDLPFVDVERHILEIARTAKAANTEDQLLCGRRSCGAGLRKGFLLLRLLALVPHDHPGQHFPAQGGLFQRSDRLAVAKDRDPIADPHHFVQAVRYEDDQVAFTLLILYQLIEEFLFLSGKGGRHLVQEDEFLLVHPKGLEQQKDLFFIQRKVPHPALGIDLQARLGEYPVGFLPHPLPVQKAELASYEARQKKVLDHREIRNHFRFLGDDRDALSFRLGGVQPCVLDAPNDDLPGRRSQDTRKDIEQRAFSRPVLADDPVDFSLLNWMLTSSRATVPGNTLVRFRTSSRTSPIRLVHHHPAADVDRLPRQVIRILRGQEQRHPGNIRRAGVAAQGDESFISFLHLGR